MADSLPVVEWVVLRQCGQGLTWEAVTAIIAPDLRAALTSARCYHGDDVLRAEHIGTFGGWAPGHREKAAEHVAAQRLAREQSARTPAFDLDEWNGY